jgi:Ras-related protein Rab-18
MAEREEFTVFLLLAGDTGVGKSTLAHRLTHPADDFEPGRTLLAPTLGIEFTFVHMELADLNADVKVNVMDVPGNTQFARYMASYYRMAHGIVFMYDVGQRATFDSLAGRWRDDRDQHNPRLTDAAALVLGNKADLPESEHGVTAVEGADMARQLGAGEFEVCSATEWSRRYLLPPIERMIVRAVHRLRLEREHSRTTLQLSPAHGSPSKLPSSACCG